MQTGKHYADTEDLSRIDREFQLKFSSFPEPGVSPLKLEKEVLETRC